MGRTQAATAPVGSGTIGRHKRTRDTLGDAQGDNNQIRAPEQKMNTTGLSGGGLPPDRKNAYSYDELMQCARGELFDPNSAKLPLPDMLMTDRVTLISNEGGKYGKGQIDAELDIHPDLCFSNATSWATR